MEFILKVLEIIIALNWLELIGSFIMVLTGLYGIFLVIPGEQPDKAIAWILEFTKKLSKK